MKPADTAPIEDWVFYAAMLEQRQAKEEAADAWKFIASKRPDLGKPAAK